MSNSYSQKLKDPRWKARRLEIIKRNNFTCQKCGRAQANRDYYVEFQVHHVRYIKGREPWEYADDELLCWCWKCHEIHHYLEERPNLLETLQLAAKLAKERYQRND